MVNALETILQQVVDITILLFEFMGVLVIIAAGLRGIYDSVKRKSLHSSESGPGHGFGAGI